MRSVGLKGAARLAAARMKRFSTSANSGKQPMNRRRVSGQLGKVGKSR
jgi:hypothetical protein